MQLMGRRLFLPLAAVVAAALTVAPRPGAAQLVVDATNDFLPGFPVASRAAYLDVTRFVAYRTSDGFLLAGSVNGNIPTNVSSLAYIFGVNRGTGVARFAGIGVPGVLFDAVVIARPAVGGADQVNLCFPPNAACNTDLPVGGAIFNGNTFLINVPGTLLPLVGGGFASQNQFTFNLWPRLLGTGGGNAALEIPDFAPDNSNVAIAGVIPEPATLLLVGPALAGLALVRRRRRAR